MTPQQECLLDALAELFAVDGQYEKALSVYLDQRSTDARNISVVLSLVQDHGLFHIIQDKLLQVAAGDPQRSVLMFVENSDKFPVASVVAQLRPDPLIALAYLTCMFDQRKAEYDRAEFAEYHNLQVYLHVTHQPAGLLSFLRLSHAYDLDKALALCSEHKPDPLVREIVFLQKRQGNFRGALSLLVDKLGDIAEAVAFVAELEDRALWEDLVSRCCRSSFRMGQLLSHCALPNQVFQSALDPCLVVDSVPKGMNIPGLVSKITGIVKDQNLRLSVTKSCATALKSDCVDLLRRLHKGQHKPVLIGRGALKCQVCEEPLYRQRHPDDSISVFFCGHAYHELCLLRRCARKDADVANIRRDRSSSNASSASFGGSGAGSGAGGSRVGRGGYGLSSLMQQSFGSPGGGARRGKLDSVDSEDGGGSPTKAPLMSRARGASRGSVASYGEFDEGGGDMERLYCTFCASRDESSM